MWQYIYWLKAVRGMISTNRFVLKKHPLSPVNIVKRGIIMDKTKEIREYEKYLHQCELARGTIEIYVRQAEGLLNFIDNSEIEKEKIIEYKQCIQQMSYAPATKNLYITAVNRYLVYRGYGNCVIKTRRIQRRRSIENVINTEEYRRMLEYARESGREKYYHIMRTIALTGIRVSELCCFTVEILDKPVITVDNKGKIREIYLSEEVIKGLKDYCRQEKIKEGVIFRGKNEEPISRIAVYKMLVHMADMLNIPKEKVHPHSFRHLFALTYMERYGNLAELADILGHSSLETTRIYTVTSVREKRNKLNKLGL